MLYVKLSDKEIVLLVAVFYQSAKSYHRTHLPTDPCPVFADDVEYRIPWLKEMSNEDWKNHYTEVWQEFVQYFDSTIMPSVELARDVLTRCQSYPRIKYPSWFSFLLRGVYLLQRKIFPYIDVNLFPLCEKTLNDFCEQVALINETPDKYTQHEKYDQRMQLSLCHCELQKNIYDKRIRYLFDYIEHYRQTHMRKFHSVTQFLDHFKENSIKN